MRLRGLSATRRPQGRMVVLFGLTVLSVAGGAAAPVPGNPWVEKALRVGRTIARAAVDWYETTAPADRVAAGGLAACAVLGGLALLERLVRARRRRVLPNDFMKRYQERLKEGKLDRGKALDLCELNPSPAAKVALAAVKRWGRPTVDLDRAVAIAVRVEADKLRRNVGTLRRLSALAPLLGLMGTLFSVARALQQPQASWGTGLAAALGPLTAGVGLGILFLVAYDGLMGRVEGIVAALDRLGAETVDAIATSAPIVEPKPAPEPRPPAFEPRHAHAHAPSYDSHRDRDRDRGHDVPHRRPQGPSPAPRTPHQIRVDIPDAMIRAMEQGDDLYDV